MLIDILIEKSPVLVAVFVALFGACFGSFAALIIFRIPRGESLVLRSHCESCGRTLRIWQNIPIISWLVLRARCAFCKKPIGFRPIFMEIIFAIGLLALYLKFGISVALIERFMLLFLLICLAYIDLDTFYLPLSLLFALLIVGVLSSLIYYFVPTSFVAPARPPYFFDLMVFNAPLTFSIQDRIAGALLGFFGFASLNVIATFVLRKTGRLSSTQWAMGFGDPVLLMAIGLFVGASRLVLIIFLASALGSLVGILARMMKKNDRVERDSDLAQGALPYGPFLAIAASYAYLF